MARRSSSSQKRKPLTAVKLVREKARAQIGPVPPTSLVPDKRRRPEKHKPNWTAQS